MISMETEKRNDRWFQLSLGLIYSNPRSACSIYEIPAGEKRRELSCGAHLLRKHQGRAQDRPPELSFLRCARLLLSFSRKSPHSLLGASSLPSSLRPGASPSPPIEFYYTKTNCARQLPMMSSTDTIIW